MIPHITIYTDNLPANVGGRANGPVVRIKPQYRNDAGIRAHELVHVKQWYVGVLIGVALAALLYFVPVLVAWRQFWPIALGVGASLHSLAYLASDSYKLWAEVHAYREQAKHYPDDRRWLFAGFITWHYGLSISQKQAYDLLAA